MQQMNKNRKGKADIFKKRLFVRKGQAEAGHASGRMLLPTAFRPVILLMLCIAVLDFTACGKDSGQKAVSPSFEASSQVENSVEEIGEPVELTEEEKKLARLSKQKYLGTEQTVEVLGLQTYKKLKSDRYTDKAPKGKVYLVLFLKLWNDGKEKFYFNPYQLTAKVDGKEIENTVLWNGPENYPTAFQNLEEGRRNAGFVAWTVPKDWKKLHVEYQGFDPGKEALMKMDLTTEELLTPDEYDPKVYE